MVDAMKLAALAGALYPEGSIAQGLIAATESEGSEYLEVVRSLIGQQGQLRGSVFVQIPAEPGAGWNPVLGATQPICWCGERRLLLPVTPRKELVPATYHSYTLAQGEYLYLAPWGGDAASAYL